MPIDFSDVTGEPGEEGAQDVLVLEVMDFDRVKLMLQDLTDKAAAIAKAAESLQVTDETSAKKATEMGVQVSRLIKDLDGRKDELVKPYNEYVSKVRNFAKMFLEPLKSAKALLSRKLSEYTTRVELERRKAEDAARKEREALQAKIDQEAAEAGVEAPTVPTPVSFPQAPTTSHRTESGSSYGRKDWDIKVLAEEKVPREYCSPDMKKIRAAVVTGGVRQIDGVHIEEVLKTAFRG